MELVDVGDSKSPGSDTVSVRVRPEALKDDSTTVGSFFLGLQKLWGTSQHFGGPLWGTAHKLKRILVTKTRILFFIISIMEHGSSFL